MGVCLEQLYSQLPTLRTHRDVFSWWRGRLWSSQTLGCVFLTTVWTGRLQGTHSSLPLPQFLIVPAIVGSALLHRLSDDCWEKITAWIYGMGLCALFIVSTVFHIVSWKKSHLRYSGALASSEGQDCWLRVASWTGMFWSNKARE